MNSFFENDISFRENLHIANFFSPPKAKERKCSRASFLIIEDASSQHLALFYLFKFLEYNQFLNVAGNGSSDINYVKKNVSKQERVISTKTSTKEGIDGVFAVWFPDIAINKKNKIRIDKC